MRSTLRASFRLKHRNAPADNLMGSRDSMGCLSEG
jgi:hypothetical protein